MTESASRRRAFGALVALERGEVARLRPALQIEDLPARDRALALELSTGVERRRVTLDAALVALAARGRLPGDPFVRTALRIGAYQVLFLPRIPLHAAVHSAVDLLRVQKSFVNAVLRRLGTSVVPRATDPAQRRRELALPPHAGTPRTLVLPGDWLPDPEGAPERYLGAVHGVADALIARWLRAFGIEQTTAMAAASAAAPSVLLRVNRLRTDAAALRRVLAAEGVDSEPLPPPLKATFLAVRDVAGASPFATPAFAAGLFSVQDPTAYAAALAVEAVPGESILDLCAAPGGKATALAEMLGGRGTVFAFDANRSRLAKVSESATRLGLTGVLRVVVDLTQAPACFDAVLADVPCSNTGVLARRVEARRRDVGGSLEHLVAAQIEILRAALARTRPGGRTVYSTCSLESEENRGVVDAVLASVPEWRLEREQLTLPASATHDGGYFAVLRREGSAPV